MATKDLAVLSIPQLPEVAHIKIHTIKFDGEGDEFAVKKGRDFYLTPGKHTASFTFVAPAPPGVGGWFVPNSALTFPGPKGIPLGAVSAPANCHDSSLLFPTLEAASEVSICL